MLVVRSMGGKDTLSELDVPLAHGDGAVRRVDQQRAVGGEAAGAPARRGADFPAAEPVARRECGSLPFREPAAVRREPGQPGHDAVQEIEEADPRHEAAQHVRPARAADTHLAAHVPAMPYTQNMYPATPTS